MGMILAISASELETMRRAQQLKPRPPARDGGALPRHDGVAYYRRALEDFGAMLRGLDYRSAQCLNEALATFFLMVVYEQQFGRHTSGMEAHLRGLYAFLATLFATKGDSSWAARVPLLGQQLLLFTMYINLNLSVPDSLPRLWREAGHKTSCVAVMDQLFHNTRDALRNMWTPGYPTEELVDDISVSRPLQFYHECCVLKTKLLLAQHDQSAGAGDEAAWQRELDQIGRRFQDLLAVGRRPDVDMREHELQAIQFAVAEYRSLAVYTHRLFCSSRRSHSCRDTCCRRELLAETLTTLRRVIRDDREMAVRVQWPLLVLRRYMESEAHQLLRGENIDQVLGSRGLFHHLGPLWDSRVA
ncbi:hypothetical protein JDV02_003821 [Purpureocillium takamizusanense]|uniref:Uncharacterized protein n=1 Tax=Purpureocillium takamizusanense TaxID=2060973 RepID=A0A9Q8V8T5_9HYPO|nr:uncharacterized protein JDV02_003821 [Purpureocillium takamizusanense]UNI17480.1 hypothetical protein JDV02_003821 [Purpureocillium takamizusanense]